MTRRLSEQFIDPSQRPMSFGVLPIEAKHPEAPVVALERWRLSDDALHKAYRFRRMADRDAFVSALLAYERQVEHHARTVIDDDVVELRLQTKDVGKVTSLDKEYARFADVVWKDLVFTARADDVPSDDGSQG